MKNLNKVILSTLVLGAFATNANAQTADQAQASASARIVTAIQIDKNNDLNFGNIIRGAAGGTVKIAATSTGARTASGTGNTITLAGAAGTYGAAMFTVTGDGAATYAITRTPAAGTALTLTNAAASATMDAALVVSAGGTDAETTTGLIGGTNGQAAQTQAIYVGGSLTVTASQASGLYTIANGITISVDYN